jgi:guanylate kinase
MSGAGHPGLGRVIVLSGPSGAGKTTLHDLLLKAPAFRGRLTRSISATTRAPRGTEQHGREYLFLTRNMFTYKTRAGHFLEWARVFDNYYGTPLRNVRELLRRGKSVLLCIDVQGALEVKRKVPEALLIFVKAPSMKELERRLSARATDNAQSVALRLKAAAKELKQAGKYDHVIVNDDLPRAYAELAALLEAKLPLKGRR